MHKDVTSLFESRPERKAFLDSDDDLARALKSGHYDEAMLKAFVRFPHIFKENATIAKDVIDAIGSGKLEKPKGYT